MLFSNDGDCNIIYNLAYSLLVVLSMEVGYFVLTKYSLGFGWQTI